MHVLAHHSDITNDSEGAQVAAKYGGVLVMTVCNNS